MVSNYMAINMTPCEIEFMLHCYVSPEPHPRYYAPAIMDAARRLNIMHLISFRNKDENDRPVYEATEKGKFYVKMLCETPFPEQRYVDPRKEIINLGDSINGRSI
jgi:hypothetical protein